MADRIVSYAQLATEMRELVALREQWAVATIKADEAIKERDRLKQQCEDKTKRVEDGMATCDIKSDGNYGWLPRFLRFLDCLLSERKS